MNKKDYKVLVNKHVPKEPKFRNIIIAFFSGGFIGFLTEFLSCTIMETYGLSSTDAGMWVAFIVIFASSLLTALGIFDNWVSKCKCGFIIPTTGFAHSISSCAIDYKKDGLITGLGSNFFKLAGSVILYGIVSSFFLVVLKILIGG